MIRNRQACRHLQKEGESVQSEGCRFIMVLVPFALNAWIGRVRVEMGGGGMRGLGVIWGATGGKMRPPLTLLNHLQRRRPDVVHDTGFGVAVFKSKGGRRD